MGDPRKARKTYDTPPHPWQRARLEREAVLVKEFGLKNKKEVWKMESLLRRFKRQAKNLIVRTDPQAKKEEVLLLQKLFRLGLLGDGAKLEDILDLDTKHVMNRRLQTMVKAMGLARTVKQARQMIVHEHVKVKGGRINAPSYLVKRGEEESVVFDAASGFASPDHPERVVQKKEEKPVEVKEVSPSAEKEAVPKASAQEEVEKVEEGVVAA